MRHGLQRRIVARWQTLLRFGMTAVMAIMMLGFTASAFAALVLPPDAQYSRPRLDQGSQGYGFGVPFTWANVIPNALASYYTYVPFKNADAVALGFPSTCGNPSLAAAQNAQDPDWVSTDDCYVITVKRFTQPMSLSFLGAPWNALGGDGLKDATGTAYFGPTGYTDVYGYGSGGVNWTPPQFVNDGTVNAPNIQPVAAPVAVTGNAPKPFTDGTYGTAGIWHYPAPTIKGTKGRPVRVQWLNELPNTIIPGFDPTVDCSNNAPNCFPYNRIVTHAHGAHVGPESDGLAHASFNPDFSITGTKFNQSILPSTEGPPGTYVYPMNQEAATIWYHDHAVGTTHLNVNQGLAGFFPITDSNEQCLQGIGTGCSKLLPTGDYEVGLALQDRTFYTDGQFAMPDAPVIDANFPTCNPATPVSRLATCAPLFMYIRHAANAASLTPAGIHLVPYNAATIDLTIPENAQAPVLATSATLEFFGNMPVVNGVVYGKYDVEPRVYRMRFLGGTDSRTWILQLQRRDTLAVIPLWMIGSEQGLLNNPVNMPDVYVMPGERIDVLVDFTNIPVDTKIVLNNLGPDTPYQGGTIVARSTDIPEIMEFNTVAFNNAVADVPPPTAATNLHPLSGTVVPLTATPGVPVRVIALEEIVDEYGRVMPTIDRRGYDLPGIPATEIVKVNDTEIWDVINTTADAHTIHLHQVKFQVVHRQPYLTFTPAVNDPVNNVFSQAAYTAAPGTAVPPTPRDAGWKDTDEMIPGEVTRIIATFDLVGEYVWHCHILSHEEHDMMRPMVVAAAAAAPPVSLTVPLNAPNAGRTATVTVGASPTPGMNHIVEYKLLTDPNWTTNISTGLTPTITFPGGGVYELRAKAVDPALTPTLANSAYVSGSNTITVVPPIGGGTLSASAPSPHVATGLSFAITGLTGSGSYDYKWYYRLNGGPHTLLQNYGVGTATLQATALPGPGVYSIYAYVRNTGSLAVYELYKAIPYTIVAVAPATGGTLNASAASPQTAAGLSFAITGLTGSGAYDYQWSYRLNDGPLTLLQDYGVGTATLQATTLPGPGVYSIYVYVRNTGSLAAYELYKAIPYTIVAVAPATGGTLNASAASPQTAAGLSFAITGLTGSGAYDYKWYYRLNGGPHTLLQNYGVGTATLQATALPGPGVYSIYAYVRNTGSPAVYELYKAIPYTIVAVAPATGGTLNASAASPQTAAGLSFAITGLTGSGAYDYQWSYRLNDGPLTLLQDYGVGTATLQATTLPGPGVYSIYVYVRNTGSLAAYELYKAIPYTIVAVAPATGGTLNASAASPQTAAGLSFAITGLTGSGAYDYKWYYRLNGGPHTLLQNYGVGTATLQATTLPGPGVYSIYVYVRNTGSPAVYELYKAILYTIL